MSPRTRKLLLLTQRALQHPFALPIIALIEAASVYFALRQGHYVIAALMALLMCLDLWKIVRATVGRLSQRSRPSR